MRIWMLLLVTLALLPLPVAGQGRVLRVPSQYVTIQAAINAAGKGDTVLVAPGTYYGPIYFLGKSITVRSSAGPAVTILDGRKRGSVVSFVSGEKRDAVLDGFTITNGAGTPSYYGGGIYCRSSSPTIINNVITGNACIGSIAPTHRNGVGGGIDSAFGSPAIVNNIISYNRVEGYIAVGGGISLTDTTGGSIIANNVIFGNVVTKGFLAFDGGGIYVGGPNLIANNTIYGNTAGVNGGISSGAAQYTAVITNCIVRENISGYGGEVGGTVSVTYSNIKGGFPGTGNIDADPRFVDAARNDFHLRHDSPCRNKGTKSVAGLPPTDFEGDPRVAGAGIDIGADEFFPHLYHTGTVTPGGSIRVNLIGSPGSGALFAVSPRVLNPPLSIPGLKGMLYLDPVGILLVPLPPVPPSGVTGFATAIPTSFPKGPVPSQGLVGTELTNLDTVHVR